MKTSLQNRRFEVWTDVMDLKGNLDKLMNAECTLSHKTLGKYSPISKMKIK